MLTHIQHTMEKTIFTAYFPIRIYYKIEQFKHPDKFNDIYAL